MEIVHKILTLSNEVVDATFGQWTQFSKSKRAILKRTPVGDVTVSTIFLGIDLGFGSTPLWFETMVFSNGVEYAPCTRRYGTYNEAIEGHRQMVLDVVRDAANGLLTPGASRAVAPTTGEGEGSSQ